MYRCSVLLRVICDVTVPDPGQVFQDRMESVFLPFATELQMKACQSGSECCVWRRDGREVTPRPLTTSCGGELHQSETQPHAHCVHTSIPLNGDEGAWPELLTASSGTIRLHGDVTQPPQKPPLKPVSPAYGGFSICCGQRRLASLPGGLNERAQAAAFSGAGAAGPLTPSLRVRDGAGRKERESRRGEEEVGEGCLGGGGLC